MQRTHYLGVAIATALMGLSVPAGAQDGEAAEAGEVSEPAAEPAAEATEDDAEAAEEHEDPMGWFGIGLKLGVGSVGESDFDLNGVNVTTDARTGFQLAVPINLGGDGFGWIFEPYLNLDSDVSATGLYTGPNFNIHIMDPLYVGFGFGLKFASLGGDGIDLGLDIGGRVPVTATYYLYDDIGLIGEFGFGYTASGYKPKKILPTDEPELNFGNAFAWDFSVGVRWP